MRQPLNLPAGSVRALLALAVILTVATLALLKMAIPETLTTLAGMVVAYYFKARETEKGGNDVP